MFKEIYFSGCILSAIFTVFDIIRASIKNSSLIMKDNFKKVGYFKKFNIYSNNKDFDKWRWNIAVLLLLVLNIALSWLDVLGRIINKIRVKHFKKEKPQSFLEREKEIRYKLKYIDLSKDEMENIMSEIKEKFKIPFADLIKFESFGETVLNKEYYDNGQLESIETFNEEKRYYKNGQLKYRKSINNRHTVEERYYENGQLKEYETSDEDKRYYENGVLEIHSYNIDGKHCLEQYYENGNIKCREIEGDLCEYYNEDGSKDRDGYRKDHERNGIRKSYSGLSLYSETEYKNGIILRKKCYYNNGKIHIDLKYKNGFNDEECEFDENGNLIVKTIYTDEYKTVIDYKNGGKTLKYKISRIDNHYKNRYYNFFPE